ncbi:MAG: hypothetical protein GXP53_01110 [Deltaproteobacteria bacterium]|nr:hypothetical protein [Deltaproteobacteria bacterium]
MKRHHYFTSLFFMVVAIAILAHLFSPAAALASGSGYSEYYIPGDEVNMNYVLDDIGAYNESGDMHAIISVTAWSANTTVYYDHWENGYNFDPDNPVSTADETYTLAAKGDSKIFESANIPTNPRGTATYYDGMDRIYVAGGAATVSRASWTEAAGTLLAVAWEVYPVRPQLTTYIMPFGEDLAAKNPPNLQDFERVYALVQATSDSTTVTVDMNGDGTPDQLDLNRDGVPDATSVTLNAGNVFLLDRVSGVNPLTLLYSYDFESGAQGFTVGGTDGTPLMNWELGDPATISPPNTGKCTTNCYGGGPNDDHTLSGVNCWGTDLNDLYSNSIGNIYLYSPVYDFTGKTNIEISYWEWLEIEGNNYDFARLQYSTDGGTIWNDVWVYGDSGGEGNRIDTSWSKVTFDASAYADNQSSMQWRWVLQSDGGWEWGGWYIDDVVVGQGNVGLDSGTIIQADKTVQIQYVVGDQGSNYEVRGLSAFPRGFWDNEYYAPVHGGDPANEGDTDIYLYNPHASALAINYETAAGNGTFSIPSKTTSSFFQETGSYVPRTSAVYLSATDVFWGVSIIDTSDGDTNSFGAGRRSDWGYSLVPAFMLDDEHYMGWAPGAFPPNITGNEDDSGVYISPAVDNVRIYVDRDNDGIAEDFYDLSHLSSQYIFDSTDGDMSNANIYATGPYTAAYGQNPDTAGSPRLSRH